MELTKTHKIKKVHQLYDLSNFFELTNFFKMHNKAILKDFGNLFFNILPYLIIFTAIGSVGLVYYQRVLSIYNTVIDSGVELRYTTNSNNELNLLRVEYIVVYITLIIYNYI